MRVWARVAALCVTTGLWLTGVDSAAQEPSAGETLFRQQCGVCHAAEKGEPHRMGPTLWGVVGRKAGSFADFSYSPGFRKKLGGKVWTGALIDRWITDPQALAPGTVMSFQLTDAGKRAAIVDYLKTLE